MANFKYVNDLNNMMTIDSPITKGPVPRWRRKQKGDTSNASSSNASISSIMSKTPSKLALDKKKTPSKTPSKSKSPGRSPARTPSAGDRFIPMRSATNFDLAHYKLNQETNNTEESPTKTELQRIMSENLNAMDINKHRILSFQKKAPSAPEGFQNPMQVLYSHVKTPSSAKANCRYIPQAPDRILDAPDIIDDFYLNLIDWSDSNILAAALGSFIYIWDAATGKIDELVELPSNDYVCSVAWIQDGDTLAVGRTNGTTELWDCSTKRRLRILDGHSGRVGALDWNSYVLTSGSRTGHILHHDVRVPKHLVGRLVDGGHTQEVCGLKWSPDGRYLASGANDNLCNVWAASTGARYSTNTPLYSFSAHQAAVKALAWCPWQPHLLASGGGTADRHIRVWNCNTGGCVNSVDTKSQVCALLWSTNYKELVSGHGYANNQIIIWKYPALTRTTELAGHTARVLHLAMSPDGSTMLSAGADETLRLWKAFAKDKVKAKDGVGAAAGRQKVEIGPLKRSIR